MSKTTGPDYERPVRLATLTFRHGAGIRTPGGRETLNYIDATKGYALELHLRQRIVRIWSTRLDKAPVTTLMLGDNDSWTILGDEEAKVVEIKPEGPRAA